MRLSAWSSSAARRRRGVVVRPTVGGRTLGHAGDLLVVSPMPGRSSRAGPTRRGPGRGSRTGGSAARARGPKRPAVQQHAAERRPPLSNRGWWARVAKMFSSVPLNPFRPSRSSAVLGSRPSAGSGGTRGAIGSSWTRARAVRQGSPSMSRMGTSWSPTTRAARRPRSGRPPTSAPPVWCRTSAGPSPRATRASAARGDALDRQVAVRRVEPGWWGGCIHRLARASCGRWLEKVIRQRKGSRPTSPRGGH